jgi:hypothetical protein
MPPGALTQRTMAELSLSYIDAIAILNDIESFRGRLDRFRYLLQFVERPRFSCEKSAVDQTVFGTN